MYEKPCQWMQNSSEDYPVDNSVTEFSLKDFILLYVYVFFILNTYTANAICRKYQMVNLSAFATWPYILTGWMCRECNLSPLFNFSKLKCPFQTAESPFLSYNLCEKSLEHLLINAWFPLEWFSYACHMIEIPSLPLKQCWIKCLFPREVSASTATLSVPAPFSIVFFEEWPFSLSVVMIFAIFRPCT